MTNNQLPITNPQSKIQNLKSEIGILHPELETLNPQLETLMTQLPPHERDNSQWRAMLFIFLNVPQLRKLVGTYFNLHSGEVYIPTFWEKMQAYLSFSEIYMAQLAFHLYNPSNPLPISGLYPLLHLDHNNFELAMIAIRLCMKSTHVDNKIKNPPTRRNERGD